MDRSLNFAILSQCVSWNLHFKSVYFRFPDFYIKFSELVLIVAFLFISTGYRREEDLYVRLIDATTKQVRQFFTISTTATKEVKINNSLYLTGHNSSPLYVYGK